MSDEKERLYLSTAAAGEGRTIDGATGRVVKMPEEVVNVDPLKMLSMERLDHISLLPTFEEQVYSAAKYYISLGWPVIPLGKPDGDWAKKLPGGSSNINYSHPSIKSATIDKWFHPDTGKFSSHNIGIGTGNKTDKGLSPVFVVDADQKGEEDGITNLKNLQHENSWFAKGPVATTPRGGKHYYFAWKEGCHQSTGKIGEAIDTRGGESNTCKGHVAVFPSYTPLGRYKFEAGGNLPPVPQWIVNKLDRMPEAAANQSRAKDLGSENVGREDLERPIEEGQAVSMLAAINPDDLEYDDWLRLGMAVKSQLPGGEGLAIWDEWSASGNRYKVNECSSRWRGFSDFGTARGGTLFYLAKQAGWTSDPEKGERSGNPVDELVAEMNHEYAMLVMGGKVRVLRQKPLVNSEWESHYDLWQKQTFIDLLSNRKIMINSKLAPVSKLWLDHADRRTYNNGLGLFPNKEAPDGYYNMWHGFGVSPLEGCCDLFLWHLEHVVCAGDRGNYEWLLDWTADAIQDPANPKGCAVVMRGGEGCGKGTYANTVGKLFGSHHRHLIDDSHLTSNFNSHLIDALTVFGDEITWGGNKKTAGKLKGMVTERYLMGERKGVDAVQYTNMIHLMLASNSDWVIPADFDSRRWFVLDVLNTKVNERGYFDELYAELEDGGYEAFLWLMLQRKLAEAAIRGLRRAPETKGLDNQRSQNNDPFKAFIVDLVNNGRLPRTSDRGGLEDHCITKQDLDTALEEFCQRKNVMPPKSYMRVMMKNYGLEDLLTSHRGDSGPRYWRFAPPNVWRERLSEKRLYVDEWNNEGDTWTGQ